MQKNAAEIVGGFMDDFIGMVSGVNIKD